MNMPADGLYCGGFAFSKDTILRFDPHKIVSFFMPKPGLQKHRRSSLSVVLQYLNHGFGR
jgi:hypothetical protein